MTLQAVPDTGKPINISGFIDDVDSLIAQINTETEKSFEMINWMAIHTKVLLLAHLLKIKRNKGEDVSELVHYLIMFVNDHGPVLVQTNTKAKLLKTLAIKKTY